MVDPQPMAILIRDYDSQTFLFIQNVKCDLPTCVILPVCSKPKELELVLICESGKVFL